MNLLKWLERKTSLKHVSREYVEIESKVSSGFKCKLKLFAMGKKSKAAFKLRVSQVGSIDYYDLDEVAAEALLDQLEDALMQRKQG